MTDELSSFIDTVYREPYATFRHNCLHKSLKLRAKAKELGKTADLVTCISIVPNKAWRNFPIVLPHFYIEIDGKKIDVSLDPAREKKYCKNTEKKLVMPVNISRLTRNLSKVAGCWSFVEGRPGRKSHGN